MKTLENSGFRLRPWWLAALLAAGCAGLGQQAATQPATGQAQSVSLQRVTTSSTVSNVTVTLPQAGWNSVGLQSQRVSALSADPAISGFAVFENGAYSTASFSADQLSAGAGGRRGMFVFNNGATPATFSYSGRDDGTALELVNGYNLVSFTTSTDLPGSSLGTLPANVLSTFTQINADNTQTPVNVAAGGVLRAGRPYWVFSNGPARLALSAPTPTPTPVPTPSGPTVTSLSPSSGWVGGTSGVTITGTGFSGVTGVKVGGTPVLFTVLSSTQIQFDIPAQTSLTPPANQVPVQVSTVAGTSPAGDQSLWTYTPAFVPSNSPTSGGGGGGVAVSALGTASRADTGTNFNTLTLTTSAATTAGQTIFVCIATGNGAISANFPAVSDGFNTYVQRRAAGSPSGFASRLFSSLTTTALPAGSTITITFPNSSALGDVAAASVFVASGLTVAGATTFGDTGGGTVASTPAVTVTATTATTTFPQLVVGMFCPQNNTGAALSTFTAGTTPNAFTAVTGASATSATRAVAVYPEFRTTSAVGTETANGTLSTVGENYQAVVATFR